MSFSWFGKNVFITGGTGLLGSSLVEELLERGANVVCLVRDWVPQNRFVSERMTERAVVVRGDLRDHELLVRVINEHEIDSIFHLGAQAIVGTAKNSAMSTFESNVRGTWNLLEACVVCPKKIERVVVASSDKAYGAHAQLPYTEDAPLRGMFPYDVSKSCTDLITFSYFHTYRVPVAVTRCGNLFGAGDLNFNRLIPGTIRSALLDEPPIIRSDGKYVRDYFYVKDAVDAYLTLAEHLPEAGITGEAFNFGTETPLSVVEVVDEILRVMDKTDLVPKILNEATHEIPKQYLDCTKARIRLSWNPPRTFQEGLSETIEWYRQWLAASSRPARSS